MCDRLKLNLGSFCHFDEERLAFEGPWRCDRRPNPGHTLMERVWELRQPGVETGVRLPLSNPPPPFAPSSGRLSATAPCAY
jgi:hypothetical protein